MFENDSKGLLFSSCHAQYDAGHAGNTGFDWAESYRAHRAHWRTHAIAIGVQIPPEAWGGHVQSLPEVTVRANYARDHSGGAQYGMMLWSLNKQVRVLCFFVCEWGGERFVAFGGWRCMYSAHCRG